MALSSREVMMRSLEVVGTMGVREPQRLLKDAKALHDAVMECPDEDNAATAVPSDGRRTRRGPSEDKAA